MHTQLLSLYYILLSHLSNVTSEVYCSPDFYPQNMHIGCMVSEEIALSKCSLPCKYKNILYVTVSQPVKDARAGVVFSAVKNTLRTCLPRTNAPTSCRWHGSLFLFCSWTKIDLHASMCHRAGFNQQNSENSRPSHTGQKPHSSLKSKSTNFNKK